MDTSLHYLIMIVHSLFQKQVLAELSPLGLTAGQPKVLDYLGRHDGSVQKEIAVGCQIDPATLTGLLNRMEDKGMIERRSLSGNRRSLDVYKRQSIHRASYRIAPGHLCITNRSKEHGYCSYRNDNRIMSA